MIIPWDVESDDLFPEAVWHNPNVVIPLNQDITGVSFSVGRNLAKTYYIPRNHVLSENWSEEGFLRVIEALLKGNAVAHNLPFELVTSVCSLGIDIDQFQPDRLLDTHELASQVDENQPKGLKSLTKTLLGVTQQTYAEVLADTEASKMSELSAKQVLHYGADDSFLCGRLTYLFLTNMLLEGTYKHKSLTIALQKELARSYIQGTTYDWDRAAEQEATDRKTIAANMPIIRSILAEHADWGVNIDAAVKWSMADAENRVAMLTADGLDSGEVKAKIESEFRNFLAKTHYQPWEEVEQPIKGVKSVPFLRSVMPVLELPVPVTVSNKCISETYGSMDLSDEQFTFVTALLHAKKGTPTWEAYESLCLKYTNKEPKILRTGFEANLGSSFQKQVILYGMLGCEVRRRSKVQAGSKRMKLGCSGAPATDAGAIQMAITHDADTFEVYACLELLLDVIKARTRLSLFHDAYKNWIHIDGKVRPTFALSSTRTRRPTGSAFNKLQIPKGDRIRGSFYAPKGRLVVCADYASQEMRIGASVSGDENMLSAFVGETTRDLHNQMGAAIMPYFCKNQNHNEVLAKCKLVYDSNGEVCGMDYDQYCEWLNHLTPRKVR